MRPRPKRRYHSKKALPVWVIAGAIIFAIAVLTVIFTTLLKDFGNVPAEVADPGFKAARINFYTKIQNPDYIKTLSPPTREELAESGYIPEAWASSPPDYGVPWGQAKNADEVRKITGQK